MCKICYEDEIYYKTGLNRGFADWTVEQYLGYDKDELREIWKKCGAYGLDTDWCPESVDVCDLCVESFEYEIEDEEEERFEAGEQPSIPLHPDDAKGCRDIRTYFGAR